MVRSDKVELVQGLTNKLKESQSIVLGNFQGLTVAELTGLRAQLREQSIEIRVLKNRLIKRALGEVGCDPLDEFLTGNTAIAFGRGDPAAPAKILLDYAKKNSKFTIKGGLLEGKRLDVNGVKVLAKMPGRRELLAMMAGDMKQRAARLAATFQAGLLKMAYAIKALARKKEPTGPTPA